jgi:hypothetical protein
LGFAAFKEVRAARDRLVELHKRNPAAASAMWRKLIAQGK